ncbi:hypothetical protein, partial [Sutterella wadsworthensis]
CGVDITSVGLPTDIVLEKGETQQLNIEYGTDDKAEQEKIAEAASKLNHLDFLRRRDCHG